MKHSDGCVKNCIRHSKYGLCVVITDAARMDLLGIGRSIRLHNPQRSETFIDELIHRCLSLGDFPRSYTLIEDPKSRGIRRMVHGIT